MKNKIGKSYLFTCFAQARTNEVVVQALVRVMKCPGSNLVGDNRNVFVSKLRTKLAKITYLHLLLKHEQMR